MYDVSVIHRKIARLSRENYIGRGVYFFTICCDHQRPYLTESVFATSLIEELLQSASTNGFSIHAYCLMPDHIHILAEGTHAVAEAVESVRHFKQRTGFAFKQTTGKSLWEFSYYDHVLSVIDEIIKVARYIWWNPARKGLCDSPGDYPLSGSQTFASMQISNTVSKWAAPSHLKSTEKSRV